jgi:type III pantothenate kinase
VRILVDVGNTRIKWAPLEGGALAKSQAAAHAGWSARNFERRLFGTTGPADLLVSCVAGGKVQRAIAAAARHAGVRATFVRVPKRGGGVRVGYAEAWRLGVDRFVSAVGAVELLTGSCVCVVGVGTAMTVDLIDARGVHRGGVIIPSPDLMVQTLFRQTHGIRRRAQGGGEAAGRLFGRSTREGVVQGGRYAAAALVDRAVEEATGLLNRRPLVVLTGGGAPQIRALVRSASIGVPDLVLRGLAVLAQAEEPEHGAAE